MLECIIQNFFGNFRWKLFFKYLYWWEVLEWYWQDWIKIEDDIKNSIIQIFIFQIDYIWILLSIFFSDSSRLNFQNYIWWNILYYRGRTCIFLIIQNKNDWKVFSRKFDTPRATDDNRPNRIIADCEIIPIHNRIIPGMTVMKVADPADLIAASIQISRPKFPRYNSQRDSG